MILRVEALPGAEFTELVEEWSKNPVLQKFDAAILAESGRGTAALQQMLIERGVTDILREEPVNEQLTTPRTPQSKLISILHRYLDKVGIDGELLIVDPYFYPRTNAVPYSQFLLDVLSPYLPAVASIRVVTSTRYDSVTRAQVESDLKARRPGLAISHTTSDSYHDRFWISNGRSHGLLIGTSLNGLGNKYALVDRLNKRDVRDIVTNLVAEGLV